MVDTRASSIPQHRGTAITLPTLVIAGAPKSGTSSVHRWLADHPEVCSPLADESRYLLDAESPLRTPHGRFSERGIDGYAALFRRCAALAPAPTHILEATPDYLYQETAPRVLAGLAPRPLVLFLLRRPSARVYSHYQFARNNMSVVPRSVTFAEFVDDASRAARPGRGTRWNLQHVLRYSRYADYLGAWIERFGRDGMRAYLFEEMTADPRGFMRRVATDVGIDPGFYDAYDFPRVKETIVVRRQWLQRIRTALGSRMPDGAFKRRMRAVYESANVRPHTDRAGAADRAVLDRLDREFEPANRRLAALLDLNLGAWE